MQPTLTIPVRPSRRGEPVWELLEVLPEQGRWTEDEYLRINTNRIVEFVDGCLEVPPVPDAVHQMLVFLLCRILADLQVNGAVGKALPAAFKLKIPNGNWREPDVVYLAPHNVHRQKRDAWDYADVAVEVVSPDKPARDYVDKRADYALAGVPEYWIVDPAKSMVSVLVLDGSAYREAQVAGAGDIAASVLLPGLRVDVADLFAKANA